MHSHQMHWFLQISNHVLQTFVDKLNTELILFKCLEEIAIPVFHFIRAQKEEQETKNERKYKKLQRKSEANRKIHKKFDTDIATVR